MTFCILYYSYLLILDYIQINVRSYNIKQILLGLSFLIFHHFMCILDSDLVGGIYLIQTILKVKMKNI